MPQPIGIPCACDLPVDATASILPSVSMTIRGWFRPLVLNFITRTNENMVEKVAEQLFECQGVIQPFTATQLKLKPEGERAWKWKLLHTTPEVNLDNGQNFTIKGVPYRVMGKADWSDYGTNIYELVEDYR